jgi:prepilin-type N-terminal cleavage/methylation domain-containing protein
MSRRGFTLIECIFAAIIVLLGFLAVAKINPMSYKSAEVSRNRLDAIRAGRNVIEAVRSQPYGASTKHLEVPYHMDGEMVEGNPTGEVFDIKNISVKPFGGAGQSAAEVAVTVQWTEGTAADNKGSTSVTKQLVVTGSINHEP